MSEFQNTIDLLGEEAVAKSLLEKTITDFNDDTITKVGGYAFYKCTKLKGARLPNVTDVNRSAFRECSSLTSVDMPNVESMGEMAFSNCRNVIFGDLANLTNIGKQAFHNCPVFNLNLPSAVNIGSNAFMYCKNLVKINLPVATTVEDTAFNVCEQLVTVNIPEVTNLSSSVFYGCYKLKLVDLPKVVSIQSKAFQNCTLFNKLILRREEVCVLSAVDAFSGTCFATGSSGGLCLVPRNLIDTYKTATNWSTLYAANTCVFVAIEDYTVDGTISGEIDFSLLLTARDIIEGKVNEAADKELTYIGDYAFAGSSISSASFPNVTKIGSGTFDSCENLMSVNIPHLLEIGADAFQSCKSIISLDFPEVRVIKSFAFDCCEHLTSVNLPKVAVMENNAFMRCSALKSVRLPATPPNGNGSISSSGCVFYIPTGSLAAYQAHSSWSSMTTRYSFVEEDRE